MIKRKKFFITALFSFLIICFGLFYFFQGKFNILPVPMVNAGINEKVIGMVKFKLIFNLEERKHLAIGLAVPFKNKAQKIDIKRNLPRIKSGFLMDLDPIDLKEWLDERNLALMKSKFLQIVNQKVDRKVKNIYLEIFYVG